MNLFVFGPEFCSRRKEACLQLILLGVKMILIKFSILS